MTRHRLDIPSLLLGLLFTTIATVALVGGWSLNVGPWLWPSVLIGAGVIVLLAVLTAGRDRDQSELLDAAAPGDLDAEPDTADADADADAVAAHHLDPAADGVMDEAIAEVEAADPFTATTPMERPLGDA